MAINKARTKKSGHYKMRIRKTSSNCDCANKELITASIKRVAFSEEHISNGQKVLLYTPSDKTVVSPRGEIIGPKRSVLDTGYVLEKNGHLFVDSKALGKIMIIPQKAKKGSHLQRNLQSLVMATGIEE